MRALVLILGLFLSSHSSAQGLQEIKLGVLSHDVSNLWSSFRREEGVDLNIEAIFSPWQRYQRSALHPILGATLNTQGDTSKVYAGLRWEYESAQGWFMGLGLGAALHNGEKELVDVNRKALGSKVLFHIPIEIGKRLDKHYSLSLYFDHMSNAGLADANEGMDTLGLRLGYRY